MSHHFCFDTGWVEGLNEQGRYCHVPVNNAIRPTELQAVLFSPSGSQSGVPCPLEPARNANSQAPPAESESLGVGVSGSLCFQKTLGAFDAAQAENHSLVNASFLACTFWGLCLGLCVTGLLHG